MCKCLILRWTTSRAVCFVLQMFCLYSTTLTPKVWSKGSRITDICEHSLRPYPPPLKKEPHLNRLLMWFVIMHSLRSIAPACKHLGNGLTHYSVQHHAYHLRADLLFFFVFFGGRAAPVAYGGSQARVPVRAVTTDLCRATATWDLNRICNLHHSSEQHQILDPLSKARYQTHVLMDSSHYLATMGTI